MPAKHTKEEEEDKGHAPPLVAKPEEKKLPEFHGSYTERKTGTKFSMRKVEDDLHGTRYQLKSEATKDHPGFYWEGSEEEFREAFDKG